MENTFWDINRDSNFVERFKKSFTLYVESGMKEEMERDRDFEILRGEFSASTQRSQLEDFKEKFYKFIADHYLPHPHPQAFELEWNLKKEKKSTWLQKLMLKFRRKQRA